MQHPLQIFVQQLINGLSIGSTYALIALGYTMVYGVLRLINFAHGDVYMVGALIAWYICSHFSGPAWLVLTVAFATAMLGCTLLGFAIEFFAYRPLRSRPRLVALITAIGVSFLLENLGILIYGPTPHAMPALFVIRPIISFHVARNSEPVSISNLDVLSLALMVALMIVLTWMVLKTKTGLALRAVSHRFDTAALMGINPNRTISFTFMFGSALAAIAGVLNGIRYNVEPLMGVMPGIKAFVAAVLGGIGNIPGAVIGGLLMGLIETMLKGWILPSGYTGYADAAAFLVLILILLIKPSGLLGRHVPEKV